MALSEFSLIETYFSRQISKRQDVVLGIGDDAALLTVPPNLELAVAIDTLVEGRHFPVGTDAEALGYKALAVNLSDMAAMGAEPAWMTLSLSLPEAVPGYLESFAQGLFQLAEEHSVELVGGDTVRGPLCVSVQLAGYVPTGQALRRSGAQVGDAIYVTGKLGDAGAGLALLQGRLVAEEETKEYLCRRLEYPIPRVSVGMAIREIASSAIDISDGLAADLGHILDSSEVGASLEVDNLPLSNQLTEVVESIEERERYALGAGDDYELCFTVPEENQSRLEEVIDSLDCPIQRIGLIEEEAGLRLKRSDGKSVAYSRGGYDHFAGGEE